MQTTLKRRALLRRRQAYISTRLRRKHLRARACAPGTGRGIEPSRGAIGGSAACAPNWFACSSDIGEPSATRVEPTSPFAFCMQKRPPASFYSYRRPQTMHTLAQRDLLSAQKTIFAGPCLPSGPSIVLRASPTTMISIPPAPRRPQQHTRGPRATGGDRHCPASWRGAR
eukprot:3916045-Prymnesium_polylepis.1